MNESRLGRALTVLTPYFAMLAALALAVLIALSLTNCEPGVGRAAVSLKLGRAPKTPADAAVTIDDEYIGPLAYIAARGVRLPVGKHHITVEKAGYFPWDQLVEADRDAIFLKVELEPIPD
jgi:hypothetical protein